MAEGIWIGTRPTTDEERQEIERGWYSQDNGGQEPAGQGGYYDGYMGDQGADSGGGGQAPSGPVPGEGPVEEAQPSQYWIAQPENMMEIWNRYDQDPEYVDEHYSREQINTLHDYMEYQNQGRPVDQWKPLMSNDRFVTDEIERNNWWEPVDQVSGARDQGSGSGDSPVKGQSPVTYTPSDPKLQGWTKEQELGDWDQMDWIGKLGVALSSNDPGINAPEYTRYTQAGQQALSSAMAGAVGLKLAGGVAGMIGAGGVAAALTNPWVLGAAAFGTGGLVFYQAVTGKEIPYFNKFLELSDLPDTLMEHTVGFGAQAVDIFQQNKQKADADPNDSYGLMAAINDSLKEVWRDAGSMWRAGEYTYDVYGSLGDFAIDVLKEIFKGEEGTKPGEAWYFNRGINEKQTMPEGTYGDEAMRGIRQMFAEMEELGIDKDTQTALMNEMVNRAGGTSAFVSDYTMQMLLDLDILAAPLETETARGLAKITGNELGVQAAEMNRGSILTQVPFVGSFYQAITKAKAPGGWNEFFDNWKNLARSADVESLSAVDRFFGGINKDGTIKEFARTEKTGMGELLPEAKVSGVGNIANNVLNTAMSDVATTEDIRNRLASLAGEATTDGLNDSADVRTVRDGMRHAIAETNPEIYLKQFDDSAAARTTLYMTADALGMEVKDMLSLYSETPAVFEQRVRDYAAANNGMIGNFDVSQGVDGLSTLVKGFTTAKDGKGTPLAWDIRQVQYQITTSMIDSMAQYYTDYYGVKPNSTFNLMFDTMKSAQSLVLLGWSPAYFINNVINNAVTAAAEGVLGFMTPVQIKQWMDAFGVSPARMDVDTSAEFRGQGSEGAKGGLEAFSSAASEAKKAGTDTGLKGALAGLNGALRSANNKLGVFSSLSGKMETLQGNQVTAISAQQYWRQRWKRGVGFPLLPDAVVQAIEAQTPGMTNVIYAAIEGGLNMDQVNKVLFDTYYVKPDAGHVMRDDVCAKLFRSEPFVYEEMLEKSGIMSELKERIGNCNTEAERDTVIADMQKKLNDYIDNLKREDLIQRANNVATVVEAEGLAPVAQMMSELQMNHQEFWLRIRRDWAEIKAKIREQNLDGKEAQDVQAKMVARHDKEWADLYKQEITTAVGIMNGLGIQNETHAKYVGYMLEIQKNWQEFNREKGLELQRYYERRDAIRKAAGPGKKADGVKISEAWDDYCTAVSELYERHFGREQELQGLMDSTFVTGFETATGKSGQQFRDNFQRIADIRKRMYDLQQDAHKKTKDMNREEQAEFYADFNPKYNALIREIGNLGEENAKIIYNSSAEGPGFEEHAETKLTPEQTVAATEVKDTSDAIREKAMRERNGYLDREGIRQGWIDAGRTPAEADLMMAVFDAAADAWAKQNGMYVDEFYSEAARLKGISGVRDQVSGISGQDYSVLHQTTAEYMAKYHDVIMQHFGNPAFREWFGNSKVVDEYGLPLVVHHGTNAQFEVFSKEKLGSNTGAASAKKGFFFASNPDTSAEYIPNPTKIWQAWNYVDIEEYLESNNNTAALLDDYSVSQLRSFAIEYTEKYQEAVNIFGELVDVPTPEDFINAINEYENKLLSADTESKKKYVQMMDNPYMYGFYFDKMSDCVTQGAGIANGHVMDLYLSIQNPLVHDFKGRGRDISYSQLISQAISEGRDGVILKNTYDGGNHLTDVYVVFEPTQIKSIENDGTFNKLDPNILHQQAQEIVKGTFEHTDLGNIIRMLEASDVSTMVHESGHLFRRTLSTPLLQEFTQWAGFKDVAEFQELEVRFQKNDPTLRDADRARYVDAEEKFARGFEQYLMDGSAPTPGLKAVFKAFRDYLLDIYKYVKAAITGNDYSKQGEFVFHGANGDEVLNIRAEINGVKLADIFDRMLTDDVQRVPGYTELIQNHRAELANDRHNMRMSDKALSRRAQVEITKEILQHFGGMDAAESALQNYDLPWEINGKRVDDATLFEAIQAAKEDPQMNPFAAAEWHEVKGTNSYAYSIVDANSGKKYQLQYKVVELKDLIPSNEWFGDQLVVNENYPADVQARNRQADQSDVYAHAANLNPGLLIDEQHAIDSGTPIIGDMVVESGNGRVLSLLYAQEKFPDQWANYQEYLRNAVGDYGIDPAQLEGFENPVLVRERLGGDRVTFAEDANSNRNKAMSASENALTDANKVNMGTLAALDIVPGESTDTFTTEKNAMPSVEWLRSLQESERNKYSTTNRNGDLVLSAEGKARFINALFATLYATPESMEIIKSFAETSDSNITALESALKQSLPEMARAEGLIKSGSRDAALSITGDVMAAAGLLNDARQAGMNIHDYLAQAVIPGMERWTPTQALLAGFFGDAKNNVKKMRDFFNAYGEEVYKAGDPNQLSLITETRTREQMIDAALAAAMGNKEQVSGVRGQEAGADGSGVQSPSAVPSGTVPGEVPGLHQSVMDSTEKWTSEFAKTLDENLQRTFDDGMSVPLSQADGVYLRGETNVPYDTKVQRILRDFTNDKNMSPDQYLYALEYMEWWLHGAEGEAPQGNPLWEAQIQKQIMNDFTYEHPEMVSELKRRYKKGAEVDPDTAVPSKGDYVKRVYEFQHGFWNIAGNVYRDGKLVAYLPEELEKMKRTIDVDGQQYQVLGVDLQNPEGLVYYDPMLEIVRTCNVGKPEGFNEPRNPFMFIKPTRQGATPQTMPIAESYAEIKTKYLDPALAAFGEAYKNADTAAKTAKMSGLDLGTRAQIAQWLDQDVANDMRNEKYRAIKYSDMKKDAAMLNYNQRYGFDPILTMLSPYQFWYTRSMWKWAKRMIDKPALGNAYQRMKEYEDKNRQENLPSRLASKFRIPLAYLDNWMGGSYYIDPYASLFPFSQFGQSYENNMNQATINARTEEILEGQVTSGIITAEDKLKAVTEKKGEVWANAYAQAEMEIGQKSGMQTLASQFISPNIFYTWWKAKQKGEDPGMLGSTRTGNAVRALTSDIPMVSEIGSFVGDAMSIPEKALRKLYGFDFDEFGQYGDQQIRKQISQMVADGEIDWRKGLNAMNEKSGTIWDMAADRQRKESMLKVPGFAGLEGIKQFVEGNASIGEALGGMAISLMGGGAIYPEGEKSLREMKAARDQAYIDQANGDTGAVSRWYDENPEYVTRTATYMNDPEQLLKYTLYQNITATYYNEPYAQQQNILNQLGPEFYYALFNKETKNYEAVPVEKLAEWNAALGNTNPAVGSIDVEGVERVMKLSQTVVDEVEEHDRIKAEQYPGISVIQDGYYALPKDQRADYMKVFPQLEDYWEWNRQYKNEHQDYVRWENERSGHYNERTLYQSYGDMSERTQQDLEYAAKTGKELRDFSKQELERLYKKYANPNFMSFEDYVKDLQEWK